MGKGAGMIAPNMATLLAFFTTDVDVEPGLLQRALQEAVGESLNRITVDGDTSTNDMAVILASGCAEAPPIRTEGAAYDAFRGALTAAARSLAEQIVRDGEGATRLAEVRVVGAREAAEADQIARTVAESPLVKTALHGGDPNWGRILAAVGRSGVDVDVSRVDVHLGKVWVCESGHGRPHRSRARWRRPRWSRRRSTAAIRTGDAFWPRSDAPAWTWTSPAWTSTWARSGSASPATRVRTMKARPIARSWKIPCASRSTSTRAQPPAGCGPATSARATWTSTRTIEADEALGRQLRRGPGP